MAISEKNLSISGVEDILEAGRDAYNRIVQGKGQTEVLKSLLEHIKILIDQAIEKEKELCQLAGCKNIEELRAKINQFMVKSGANNFTGINLDKTFVNEFSKVAKTLKTEEDKEIAALGQHIVNKINNNKDVLSKKAGESAKESFARYFHESLVGTMTTSGTKIDFRSRTLKDVIEWSKNGPRFVIEEITPTIKERLLNIKNTENIGNYPMLVKLNISKESINNNTLTFDFTSEWYNLTKGLTQAEIEKNLSKYPEIYGPIRDKANKVITDKILSMVTPEGKNYFKEALTKMLGQNKNMFFVGRAATEITGLLGELSTYAMLRSIFGNKVDISWTAQLRNKGKQLSLDFILGHFGVQVKNTTQDFMNIGGLNVDFVSKSSTDVMRILLGEDGSEAIGSVFESSYFNVSYQIIHNTRPHIVPGSNSEFDGMQTQLISLRQNIKQLLLMYSPQLLYMANNASLKNQLATLHDQLSYVNGNTLYMVGNKPIFMSEMLLRVKEQIQQIINFYEGGLYGPAAEFLSISGSGETIVNFLNRRAGQGELIGLEKQGFLGEGKHSGKGLKKTVQLTTSFLF